MVGIIDYGVGNLFSLCCSFRAIGQEIFVSSDPEELAKADRLVLPGVGAYEDAAKKLRASGLDAFVRQQAEAGKPLMGICLGMQLLFEKSYEYGEHEGLGLLKGRVIPMNGTLPAGMKVPHMGWNSLEVQRGKLLGAMDGKFVYFVHSFYVTECEDSLSAVTDYGKAITAAVEKDNIFGCQFHPEKSGTVGLDILKSFCEV